MGLSDLRRVLACLLLLALAACANVGDSSGPAAVQRRAAQGLAEKAKGDDYRDGKNGVGLDYTQAIQWYWLAVEHGNTGASNNLAALYLNGLGVPVDVPQALKLYRLAASGGNSYAMVNLGNLYVTGRGVPQSDPQAVAWYRKAAELGNAGGQRALGFMYLEGRGVPRNLSEASKWLKPVAQPQFTVPKEGTIAPVP